MTTTTSSLLILVGIFLPPLIGLLVFMYRQSVKIGVIESRSQELEHNGGASLKDYAKAAMTESIKAQVIANEALAKSTESNILLHNMQRALIRQGLEIP